MNTTSPQPAQGADWAQLIVEAAPNAMIMIDRERKIVLVNRGAERLFGFARNELLGERIELLLPERFRERHPEHIESFFAQPTTRAMGAGREIFGRRKDGTEVPIELGLNPMATQKGLFILASIVDISERRRAEEVQERLAAIVEGSDDAIVSKSLDGIITSWNRGAERLYGYTPQEAIGQPVLMLIPERLVDEESRILAQIRRNERVENLETVRRRKDGSEVEISLTVSPMRNAAGQLVGASKIARDITEQKRRDAELLRSNAELEQFAYIASHDLQEPLRMVANYTELLAERYRGRLDEKADKYIHYASDGARRMQRLVNDLLAYSRVGSQGRPLAPVSTEAVLKGVLRTLGPLISDSGAKVVFGSLPGVLADEGQLHQLFQNLVSNAIKFKSDAAPQIAIKSVPEGAQVRFTVADNGIGIDMQYANRIFQMFQRLHAPGRYEGSGIGLAIAKRIIERHGGRIWVESQPGAGATFFFTLRSASKGEA